jgi:hypothetical protein
MRGEVAPRGLKPDPANFFFNHDFQFCTGTNRPCWFLIIDLTEAGIGVKRRVSKGVEVGCRLPALRTTPETAIRLLQGWPAHRA